MIWPFEKNNHNSLRIFISSLPKAGTHLVMSCLDKFPKLAYGNLCLDSKLSRIPQNIADQDEDGVLIGVDNPCIIKSEVISSKLKTIKSNRFIAAHAPYSNKMVQLLEQNNYKGIAIIRDPRDVVASHVPFILKTKPHYLHKVYSDCNDFDKNLMTSITGFQDKTNGIHLVNIRKRIEGMKGLDNSPLFYSLKFEDLIGGHGGGNPKAQLASIHGIADHIGVDISDKTISEIAEKMFGGSYTFRKGVIGGWKDVFKYEHKEMFKELAGDLLIELGYEENMDW